MGKATVVSALLGAALLGLGCESAIVSGACRPGYLFENGACVQVDLRDGSATADGSARADGGSTTPRDGATNIDGSTPADPDAGVSDLDGSSTDTGGPGDDGGAVEDTGTDGGETPIGDASIDPRGPFDDAGDDDAGAPVDGSVAIDAAPSMDAGSGSDAGVDPPTCDVGELLCSGVCSSLQSSPQHCGMCGNACRGDQFCSAGTCVDVCTAPLVNCGGACFDLQTDPDHCGSCAVNCGSGLCRDGACVAGSVGHVVVIGHDYAQRRAGMSRLIGNAVFLARRSAPRVAVVDLRASVASAAGAYAAIDQVAAERGRVWTRTVVAPPAVPLALADAEVLLVLAQPVATDAELSDYSDMWSAALRTFVARGNVVIVLEAPSATNAGTFGVLRGAMLFDAVSRIDLGDTTLTVTNALSAVVADVPLTYRSELHTVGFDVDGRDAIVRSGMTPVVIHRALVLQ